MADFSIDDMAEFAGNGGGLSMDIGNVVEMGDIGDDLGFGLLANNRGSSSSSKGSGGNTVVIPSLPGNSLGGMNDISVKPMESLDEMNVEIPLASEHMSAPQFNVRRDDGPSYGGGSSMNENYQSSSAHNVHFAPAAIVDPEKEKAEKMDLINKLTRLEKKGYPVSRRYTMDNSLDEIKEEFTRLTDARQLENSIKFQRQIMMGFVTGLEMMNEKVNPLDWKLDGWSESVHENIEDFDEVFEELYDKYKEKGKMPPEARMLFMLCGSGFMYHMSNSFFRSKMPDMGDILKKNPELARQMAAAAANAAGPGFGNFMGAAMGVPQGAPQGAPQYNPAPPMSQMPPPSYGGPPVPPPMGTGQFFGSPMAQMPQHAAAAPPQQTARREMRGPVGVGVDDILNTFAQAERQQAGMEVPMMSQPAMAAAMELQSLASDEIQSQAESVRTAGGRRKRRTVAVGSTVSLNV
jgi:hypothetical protein